MVATLAAKQMPFAAHLPVFPRLQTATFSRKEFRLFEVPSHNMRKVKAVLNRMEGLYILADQPRVAFDKESFSGDLMTHWANRLGLFPLDVTQEDFLTFVKQTLHMQVTIRDVQFSMCLPQLFQAIENEASLYAELRTAISVRNGMMIAKAIESLHRRGCDVFSIDFEHERLRYVMNKDGELQISGSGFNVQRALNAKPVLSLSGLLNM